MRSKLAATLLAVLALPAMAPVTFATPVVTAVGAKADTAPLARAPMAVGGRAVTDAGGQLSYQWPGMHFQTRLEGDAVLFEVGTGDVVLHVSADGRRVATLAKPAPGRYRLAGLGAGTHLVQIDVASESQAGPNRFGGFLLPAGSHALPVPASSRQVEFIGDSHTVGYGTASDQRECSDAQVWATTDNTLAYGPRLAARYGADYRVHAISGRGIVRNYGGMAADTLPQAYPWVLFDHSARADDAGWRPQLLVVALGTNDFSTPLGETERWPDREALRADYVAHYVAFVGELRRRHPQARVLLWSTDLLDGEIRDQVTGVVAALRASGEDRVDYAVVSGLGMEACHWHPSAADHARIANLLAPRIDAMDALWPQDATR